ncbi:S-adenosyl-L-methionine-dependent methyltransferase [Wilcoxina mikolae CBS 423.85]|nr:S-adenosyl-L-methionine-dependent methyltransferase [Wilcoxina mikolae CBS 423.85]
MSSAQLFRNALKANLEAARICASPSRKVGMLKKVDIINPRLCDRALDKLALEDDYTNTNIIDMNPGLGVFSQTLHDRLKPRSHILLEPDERYHERLASLRADYPKMTLVDLDGYNWDTYNSLFGTGPFKQPAFSENYIPPSVQTLPVESGINRDLLFVGNLTRLSDARRVVSQLLQTCYLHSWVQLFGRVRFILWMHGDDKERLLPAQLQARARPSVIADGCCSLTEVASSGGVRIGRGFQASALGRAESRKTIAKRPDSADGRLRLKVQKDVDKLNKWYAYKAARSATAVKTHQKVVELEGITATAIRSYLAHRNHEVYTIDSYADVPLDELLRRFKETEDVPPPPPLHDLTKDITPEQRDAFAEFEEEYLIPGTGAIAHAKSVEDEQFARALAPPLLQAWEERNNNPVTIEQTKDVYPSRPITLIDFQPKLVPEYFRHDDPEVLNKRYLTFDWITRCLFTLRAQSVKIALKSLVPGGEYLLDEIPEGKGKELGRKRVRCLSVDELIMLAQAWDVWPFKPEDSEWGGYSRDTTGEEKI